MEALNTLTLEQVVAAYFDATSLRAQPLTLYRVDGGESRYYYNPDSETYYPSVTSLIQATTPTPYGLTQWMLALGPDYIKVRDTAAAYGTWLHMAVQEILVSGTFDFDELEFNLHSYASAEGYRLADTAWLSLARQDVLSFVAFVREHNVKPLAIEVILATPDYAGAVDLVCTMEVDEKGYWGDTYAGNGKYNTKGDPKISTKRVTKTCIVDFKSGRKGFYASHEIQLHMYKAAWELNYPDTPIDAVYNWSPSDWRTAPSFTLKDQSNSSAKEQIPHLIELWKIIGRQEPSPSLTVRGQLTPKTDLSKLYSFMSMKDILAEGME